MWKILPVTPVNEGSEVADPPENENQSESATNYMMKDDEIHMHKLLVWNGFALVGDSLIAYLSKNFSSYNMLSHGAKRFMGADSRLPNLNLILKKNAHLELRSHFKYALVGIGFDEMDWETFSEESFIRQMKDCVKTLIAQYNTCKIVIIEIPFPVDYTYEQMK